MIRTQIYLTKSEQQALRALSQRTGQPESELLRQAVERFVSQAGQTDRLSLLKQARGIWQDRTNLPDLVALRSEFDRLAPDHE